jgi:hypothetical protein
MCRWVEDAGATCGVTVIHAARQDALSAFCIATDATGVLVQPIRTHEKTRKPCNRGHYFVHIADRDHVFFDYTPRETSEAVREMFKGYAGYVQADAKSVYDVLFRASDDKPPDDGGGTCSEVACWAHFRRGFWETAIATKSVIAREALARIVTHRRLTSFCAPAVCATRVPGGRDGAQSTDGREAGGLVSVDGRRGAVGPGGARAVGRERGDVRAIAWLLDPACPLLEEAPQRVSGGAGVRAGAMAGGGTDEGRHAQHRNHLGRHYAARA